MANRRLGPPHPLRRGLDHEVRVRVEEAQHPEPLPRARRREPEPRLQAVVHLQSLNTLGEERQVPQVRDPESQ